MKRLFLFLVHNLDGNNMKLRSVQQTFERICLECGIPHKGLHALRHSFATSLIDNGVAPNVVSRLLGHSSVKFTYDRYVHPDTATFIDAVNCL